MATLVRWNPVREMASFNRAVDRFFETPAVRRNYARSYENGVRTLAVDVYEDEDNFVVEAALPGFSPEQVDLAIEENILHIKSNVVETEDEGSDNGEAIVGPTYYLRGRFHGSFERKLRLPKYVDTNAVDAKFENGVLTVTLPKAEAAKRRQIPVNVQ